MSDSASLFPLLLPQPQKSPHPLFLYHSSLFLSATPFFHISIHLSSSPSRRRSKSESVFTQSRFSRVSPSRDAVLDEARVLAHERDLGRGLYLERASWSDTAALSHTSTLSRNLNKSRTSRTLKKKKKWTERTFLSFSVVYLGLSRARWGTGHGGYSRVSLSERGISAVWEEKTKTGSLAWRVKNIMSHYWNYESFQRHSHPNTLTFFCT